METKERVVTFSSWTDVNEPKPFQVVDRDVNGWFEEHPSVTVTRQSVSATAVGRGILSVITIFYREPLGETEVPDPSPVPADTVTIPIAGLSLGQATRQFETELIRRTLKISDGNLMAAASLLRISCRVLKRKLKEQADYRATLKKLEIE